jgi:hypothetical protein
MEQQRLAPGGERITVHTTNELRNAVIVPNATAQDASLSWAARGLLLFMLSQPVDWEFRENDLVNRSPMGRAHLRSVVRELEAAGYLMRFQGRGANGLMGPSIWHVWATAYSAKSAATTSPQPWAGKPPTENPPTENRSAVRPSTEKPSTENRSAVKALATTDFSPRTGKPSADKPSTDNRPPYKTNNLPCRDSVEIKPPTPSSLREDPPLPPPAEGLGDQEPAPVLHAPSSAPHTHTELPFICSTDPEPCPCSETPGSPVKAPERALGCTDTKQGARATSEAHPAASSLPPFAEAYRGNLIAWQKARQQRHKVKPEKLTTRSLNALAYAHQQGVLEEFTQLAAEAGWLSLGFNGHRGYVDKLLADRNGTASYSRSGTLGSLRPVTTRQNQAAHDAIAKLDAMATNTADGFSLFAA